MMLLPPLLTGQLVILVSASGFRLFDRFVWIGNPKQDAQMLGQMTQERKHHDQHHDQHHTSLRT
jgi:hypothetical protein